MKARRMLSCMALGLLPYLAGGCMSLEHLIDPEQELQMYGGTKASWNYMTDPDSSVFGSIVRLFDFPLTVAFDTLLLPISAPVELTRG